MPTVFVACPTYSEEINTGTGWQLWCLATARDDVKVIPCTRSSSLIPGSCNAMLCECLNMRGGGHAIDWFAMLHADIEPEPGWIDKLIEIAEQSNADMLSVCVPVKDKRGVTSTAIASGDERNQFCRITQRQLWHPDFPETFDIDQAADALESLPDELRIESVPRVGLRLNTGCMIMRLDRPWIGCDPPQVYFENVDWIEKHNGQWRARDISEDWRFSQKVQAAGGKLVATRGVKVVHKGLASFYNFEPWGSLPNDRAMIVKAQEASAA